MHGRKHRGVSIQMDNVTVSRSRRRRTRLKGQVALDWPSYTGHLSHCTSGWALHEDPVAHWGPHHTTGPPSLQETQKRVLIVRRRVDECGRGCVSGSDVNNGVDGNGGCVERAWVRAGANTCWRRVRVTTRSPSVAWGCAAREAAVGGWEGKLCWKEREMRVWRSLAVCLKGVSVGKGKGSEGSCKGLMVRGGSCVDILWKGRGRWRKEACR